MELRGNGINGSASHVFQSQGGPERVMKRKMAREAQSRSDNVHSVPGGVLQRASDAKNIVMRTTSFSGLSDVPVFCHFAQRKLGWRLAMALELRKRVVEMLSEKSEERFKARDIAKWICENYPDEANEKLLASASLKDETELLNQLVAEIGANRPAWQRMHPQLRTTEGVKPRLFYWTNKTEEAEVQEAEQEGKLPLPNLEEPKLREHDLYPMLMDFMQVEQGVHGHRIDERKSSNSRGSGGNKWLFPDVVGIENLTHGLDPEVVAAIRASKDKQIRLWSFEVKLLINRSNVRETYFQAVSNSSWANLGYLAAAEIEGADTLKELRILYAMHGIGLIKLDAANPAESQILIPARERPDLEWAMCSRLSDENKDFRNFMKRVRQFFQTGDL
jgi:hypothetical protein